MVGAFLSALLILVPFAVVVYAAWWFYDAMSPHRDFDRD